MSGLSSLPLETLSPMIARREISPLELVDCVLEQIDRHDTVLRSYITVCADRARDDARRAEREIAAGRWRGPLHGIPVSHKDNVMTAGVRSTAHSRLLENHVPSEDATHAARLEEAGMILLGKTNTTEFACGDQHLFGATPNPWHLERYSGASSSGSASAVAAGLAIGATGTDTGGSIRAPASWCGIVGVKPTYGRVSRHGIAPLSWTQDHVGPMTRSVLGAALMLRAMAGHDARDRTSSEQSVPDFAAGLPEHLRGITVGVPEGHYRTGLEPDVARAYDESLRVLEELGASLRPVALPSSGDLAAVGQILVMAEAYGQHAPALRTRAELYGPKARRQIASGACYTAAEYYLAMQLRAEWIRELAQAFETVDALVTPTQPAGPCSIADWWERPPDTSWGTRQFNLSGNPAMTLPCGFDADGCPIGLQVVAAPFLESTMFAVAYAFERATTWHTRRPTLEGALHA